MLRRKAAQPAGRAELKPMEGEERADAAFAPLDPAVPSPGEGYRGREGMAAYFIAVVFELSPGSTV